eukprot:maker-scaffold_5-snap-gene-7.1-mRNA-1 protein AED:0.03 eAED:0.03 QI:0/1/0.5/1/0/0/2/121/193
MRILRIVDSDRVWVGLRFLGLLTSGPVIGISIKIRQVKMDEATINDRIAANVDTLLKHEINPKNIYNSYLVGEPDDFYQECLRLKTYLSTALRTESHIMTDIENYKALKHTFEKQQQELKKNTKQIEMEIESEQTRISKLQKNLTLLSTLPEVNTHSPSDKTNLEELKQEIKDLEEKLTNQVNSYSLLLSTLQ